MSDLSLPDPFRLYAEGTLATTADVKRRFVESFRATWSSLPTGDVESMTAHILEMTLNGLEVHLRDYHHSLSTGPSGNATAQFIRELGCAEIIYRSLFAAHLSDSACRYWIAHELAHLFLSMTDSDHGTSPDVAEGEVAALLVERWGFGKNAELDLDREVTLIAGGMSMRSLIR